MMRKQEYILYTSDMCKSYKITFPKSLDSHFVIENPEYPYYDHFFYSTRSGTCILLSNDSGSGYSEAIETHHDTIVKEGCGSLLFSTMESFENTSKKHLYWKEIYILRKDKDLNPGRPIITDIICGYYNVRLFEKRKYDRIIHNMILVSDTCS